MERVVVQVEVDDALPDAVVLSRVLNDGLQEVRLEVQDLEKEVVRKAKRSRFSVMGFELVAN
jgi:hypothetical protein